MTPDRLSALLHAVGIPVVVGLERLAYYGTRAVLYLWLVEPLSEGGGGWPESDVPSLLTRLMWMSAVAALAGGLGGALAGPYVPMVAGALLASVGYGLLAGSLGVWGPLVMVTLGVGLVRPNAWAALGQSIPSPWEHQRTASFVLTYAAVNLAAIAASAGVGWLGAHAAFAVGAAALFPAAVLSIGLLGVAWRVPERAVPEGTWARSAGIAVALLFLASPFLLLMTVAGELQWQGARSVGLPSSQVAWMMTANPALVMLVAAVLVVVFTVLGFLKVRWPALLVTGLAMVAGALGSLALLPPVLQAVGVAALGAGVVALAASEVAVLPVVMARLGGDGHPRATPLILALWMALSVPLGAAASALAPVLPSAVSLGVAVVLAGGGGLALVVMSLVGRRWLVPPLESDDASG